MEANLINFHQLILSNCMLSYRGQNFVRIFCDIKNTHIKLDPSKARSLLIYNSNYLDIVEDRIVW